VKSKPYNPIFVKNFIASVAIVPKAVFGSISPDKISSETNLKPIGSGPFLLDKYDQTQVNLKRTTTTGARLSSARRR
jgi:peptide/nickel transport system substrate-binding protein